MTTLTVGQLARQARVNLETVRYPSLSCGGSWLTVRGVITENITLRTRVQGQESFGSKYSVD
jgi:hypothetical protein